jgi:AmiR/NasT family two-component response regulator
MDPVGSGPGSDRVAQAVEMIRGQRNCGSDQAFDLLREKAFMLGQTLEYTALDVLDDLIRFDR